MIPSFPALRLLMAQLLSILTIDTPKNYMISELIITHFDNGRIVEYTRNLPPVIRQFWGKFFAHHNFYRGSDQFMLKLNLSLSTKTRVSEHSE
jgi:hypothetical protein